MTAIPTDVLQQELKAREHRQTRFPYQPGGDFWSVLYGLRELADEMTVRWANGREPPPDWQAAMMADLIMMEADLRDLVETEAKANRKPGP